MAEEFWNTLLKFHHEVVLRNIETILERDDLALRAFRDDMRAGFSEMHRRFDRLDALNREISATLARIEEKLES
jgi:hypothetical protein